MVSNIPLSTPLNTPLRAGVDVGGTFTDVVLLDETSGVMRSAKTPTDYHDPLESIVAGLRLLLEPGQTITALHHATTLSTNAILEGKLPTGALLTTRGFRDVLDIGRIQRPEDGIYDFTIDNPQPLITRARRLEVVERLDALGEVVTPLDEDDLRQQLRALKASGQIQTIAVCTLFSFVNPAHEQRISEIIAEEWPEVYRSLSCEVAPEIREFERSSTVVLDALLKPLLAPYLLRLAQRLAAANVAHTRIMLASGGLTSCQAAASKPVNTINSGPSAGVLAAANLGRQLGLDALITIDMGGTSLDIGVVEHGQPVAKYQGKIAGYPLHAPAIDVAAVAAGGGSLALVDALGYIQVDRESAGSMPGPASYRRGGSRPTITDADLVLQRLGQDLGGRGGFQLHTDLAAQALQTHISKPLQVDLNTAASSVLEIIQARMVKAIASNTLEKGLDIRTLPLLVYGGAGPSHGVELADALGMEHVIVPYFAGNFSAIGLLLCPLRSDESCMLLRLASTLSVSELAHFIEDLDQAARSQLKASGAEHTPLQTHWRVHMRYAGQAYDLPVELNEVWNGALTADTLERLINTFHALHERHYAYHNTQETVELVQLRVSVLGPELDFPRPPAPLGPPKQNASRSVYFTQSHSWHEAIVWQRASLAAGFSCQGAAVIEGEGSSILIPPGWAAQVDDWLNIRITRAECH